MIVRPPSTSLRRRFGTKPFWLSLALIAAVGLGIASFFVPRPQETPAPSLASSATDTEATVLPRVTDTAYPGVAVATNAPQPATLLPSPPELTPQDKALQLMQAIRQALNSTNEADQDMVFTNLLPALIALDPAAAGRLAESMEPGDGRQQMLRRVAQGWADVSAADAVNWAASLADPGERKSTLTDATFQIAQTDPTQAITLAQRFDLGGTGTMENLAQLWVDKDLPAALDWAAKQPAGTQRDQLFALIAFVQSQTVPADAMNLIADKMSPGPAQIEATMSVLRQWGWQDFAAASAWANQFQDGPLREQAMQELAKISQSRQTLNH